MTEQALYLGVILIMAGWQIVAIFLKDREMKCEREQWSDERKDLISRIQSQSYSEYAAGQARVIKAAKKPDEEKPKVELV